MRDAEKCQHCGEKTTDPPAAFCCVAAAIDDHVANETLRLKRRVAELESENERLRDAAKVAAVELDFIVNTKGMRGGMYEAAYYKLKDALSPQEKP